MEQSHPQSRRRRRTAAAWSLCNPASQNGILWNKRLWRAPGKKVGKVCIRANVAQQAGAYPGFCGMKRLGVFLLPPGWDASPSRGYPPALSSPVPIYTPGWREALWELSVLPKNTTQCPRPGLEPRPFAPESSALTMRPPHLPHSENWVFLKTVSFHFQCIKWALTLQWCKTFAWKISHTYSLGAIF